MLAHRHASPRPILAALLVTGLFASGCRVVLKPTAPEASDSPLVTPVSEGDPAASTGQAERLPAPTADEDNEWILLQSGEWLKGEILTFDGDTLEFDSEVLEDLKLDWDDVAEVRTARPFTLLLADHSAVVGLIRVTDGRVLIESEAGIYEVARSDLTRMVPGRPREANYWSGEVRVSGSASTGNTERTDSALFLSATRRTAASRLNLSLDSVMGTLDGKESVANQTFRGAQDLYLSPRFYFTPLALEVFRDRFQNIDMRATPNVGVGYTAIDRSDMEWNIDAGVGLRITRFDSVAAGEPDSNQTSTLILGTDWQSDLTQRIELEFGYTVQVGLEDVQDTNQDVSFLISTDFAWDLDFDVGLIWKWVGSPEPDESMVTPEKSDLRIEIGLSWEF